jgi:DNA-binding transcriptional MerR regulator
VPVATIKYYLREGLLPPGELTAPNQASYTSLHVRRLRLVRVLREVGELPIDAIRRVVAAIDEPGRSPHEVVGVAHHALGPVPAGPAGPELDEVDALLDRLGWEVSPQAPARAQLAAALSSLRTLGRDVDVEVFRPYAQAADRLAREELARLPLDGSADELVEQAVVGTVVFESALVALRRLAQEHHSARRHGAGRREGGPHPS